MKDDYIFKAGLLTGILIGSFFMFIILDRTKEKPPEINPCNCINYSQYALWQAKYDMYVDKNKPDSVAKYAELLNQIK